MSNVIDARRVFTEAERLKRLAEARESGKPTWDDMQLALEQARHEFGDNGPALDLAERALALLGGPRR